MVKISPLREVDMPCASSHHRLFFPRQAVAKVFFLSSFIIAPLISAATQVTTNHRRFASSPHVLLISIDGYRHDYNSLYRPPALLKFAQKGVAAKSLIPVFPTLTFPNHLSLVTGLYPGRHGIVGNSFYAPDLGKPFNISGGESPKNPRFYSGTPLWVLASQNQMVSAVYFWPGNEAPIAGHLASHYRAYDRSVTPAQQIEQILRWLRLPAPRRPRFLSLYFSAVDSAGHHHGPQSENLRQAVLKLDRSLQYLFDQLALFDFELNIIITSDHGMTQLDKSKTIALDQNPQAKALLRSFRSSSPQGATLLLYYQGKANHRAQSIRRLLALWSKVSHFKAYRPSELPGDFHAQKNPRLGDIIVLADPPYTLQFQALPSKQLGLKGGHGYDAKHSDMHGIFFAQGPQFRAKLKVESFSIIHLYPLMAHLLGLPINHLQLDGDFKQVSHLLRPVKGLGGNSREENTKTNNNDE